MNPAQVYPGQSNIARAANKKRQQLRPKGPLDLDFELEDDHIPEGFFRSDIKVRACRHLMFATDQQLQFLARAKGWHIDCTFKLCRQPFIQLLTNNAFVKYEDHTKQVPLLLVLMPGRKKNDYCKEFKQRLEILPPAAEQITLDFERAVWAALRKVRPQVKLQGCVFHWTQALWRKVMMIFH